MWCRKLKICPSYLKLLCVCEADGKTGGPQRAHADGRGRLRFSGISHACPPEVFLVFQWTGL